MRTHSGIYFIGSGLERRWNAVIDLLVYDGGDQNDAMDAVLREAKIIEKLKELEVETFGERPIIIGDEEVAVRFFVCSLDGAALRYLTAGSPHCAGQWTTPDPTCPARSNVLKEIGPDSLFLKHRAPIVNTAAVLSEIRAVYSDASTDEDRRAAAAIVKSRGVTVTKAKRKADVPRPLPNLMLASHEDMLTDPFHLIATSTVSGLLQPLARLVKHCGGEKWCEKLETFIQHKAFGPTPRIRKKYLHCKVKCYSDTNTVKVKISAGHARTFALGIDVDALDTEILQPLVALQRPKGLDETVARGVKQWLFHWNVSARIILEPQLDMFAFGMLSLQKHLTLVAAYQGAIFSWRSITPQLLMSVNKASYYGFKMLRRNRTLLALSMEALEDSHHQCNKLAKFTAAHTSSSARCELALKDLLVSLHRTKMISEKSRNRNNVVAWMRRHAECYKRMTDDVLGREE
jgi:hypothetical protein